MKKTINNYPAESRTRGQNPVILTDEPVSFNSDEYFLHQNGARYFDFFLSNVDCGFVYFIAAVGAFWHASIFGGCMQNDFQETGKQKQKRILKQYYLIFLTCQYIFLV